jgi:hypothetical protein
MAKLFKLPNGQYVDPTRVSSVEVIYPDMDEPHVVVRTMDGAKFAMSGSSLGKDCRKARDEIAEELNKLL